LHGRLVSGHPMPLSTALRIGAEVAAGLAAAHARGIIHRDVKPGNILLDGETGRVKLTDFGLARIGQSAGMTELGTILGTPAYMAPEQARGEAVDARADLFSLGAVLYHMVCGAAPITGEDTIDALASASRPRLRPVREANPSVPGWLAAIIQRLLAPDPGHRFSNPTEVEALLRRGQAELDAPPAAPRALPR